MATIAEDLEELSKAVQKAQAQKARAEIELENATKQKADALAALKEEYGVETIEDAEALKDKLSKALEDAIAKAKKALEESDE